MVWSFCRAATDVLVFGPVAVYAVPKCALQAHVPAQCLSWSVVSLVAVGSVLKSTLLLFYFLKEFCFSGSGGRGAGPGWPTFRPPLATRPPS